MASVSGTSVESNNTNNNNNCTNIPQWKRDLIQRRKQQNKVSTNNNGSNTKLCTTKITTSSNNGVVIYDASNTDKSIDNCTSKHETTEVIINMSSNKIENNNDTCDLVNSSVTSGASCTATTLTTTRESSSSSSSTPLTTSTTGTTTTTTSTTTIITKDTTVNGSMIESVACKMRFEADVSVCPSSEDTPKTTTTSTTTTLTKSSLTNNININNTIERNNLQDYNNFDSDYDKKNIICHNKNNSNSNSNSNNNNNTMDNKDSGGGVCVYAEFKKGWDKTSTGKIDDINNQIKNNNNNIINNNNKKIKLIKNGDECESDSSEELQYGPGIVNRLKSKYLNLTLREMNKSRVSVQRFRRAASLEDLLDCDDDENDKLTRKFTKKPLLPGIVNKTDRYRNSTRGNESMKRARSVEALMRCQNHDDNNQNSRFIGVRQEPVNDHIVLIDRTTVKIESRLINCGIDNDRPKALNKPKRIKPLLADTERPPPDLVKTTMRIFEGSVKKLKLKGDVAAKVATFKTINDTFKAQTVKKIVPKPPIQPKSFTNNNNIKQQQQQSHPPSSPKKIISSQSSKPITAELIENPIILEEYRNDCVVTDPIVQSVSSVVSKFQQIEKSLHSPSSSPEPIYNKLKSSPISSPEPPIINNNNNNNNNSSNNSNNYHYNNNNHHHQHKQKDSGTFIKTVSPVTSPSSPKKNLPRQNLIITQTTPVSPVNELFRNNNSALESLVKAQPEILIEETVIEEIDKEQDNNRRQQVLEEKILPPTIIDDNNIEEEENKNNVKELNNEIIIEQDNINEAIIDENIDNIEAIDGPKTISKSALDSISKAGSTMEFNFNTETTIKKSYLPGTIQNGNSKELINNTIEELKNNNDKNLLISNDIAGNCDIKTDKQKINNTQIIYDNIEIKKSINDTTIIKKNDNEITKSIGAISSLGMIKSSSSSSTSTTTTTYSQINESKLIKNQKTDLPPQKQIGIIRPLVSTKTQLPQQNLSNRELEKNLINRVKSIEQPTKVVVSLKSADEIQPVKKTGSSGSGGGGGGLWDTKPWNQQNNTMVFNFSNRKDVPDYIENDGLIISRKKEKSKVGDEGVIVLDATLDASTTDDNDWDNSEELPSLCDIKFTNDNILINGRSNLSRSPRNHKHRIHFNDQATRTFEYPSESSMLEDIGSTSCVDGETSGVDDHQQSTQIVNKSISPTVNSASVSPILGGGGLSNFTPSKVDLASEGFELGVTRTSVSQSTPIRDGNKKLNDEEAMNEEEDCLQNSQDNAAWGAEATADLLY